jgi:hypothetical protein
VSTAAFDGQITKLQDAQKEAHYISAQWQRRLGYADDYLRQALQASDKDPCDAFQDARAVETIFLPYDDDVATETRTLGKEFDLFKGLVPDQQMFAGAEHYLTDGMSRCGGLRELRKTVAQSTEGIGYFQRGSGIAISLVAGISADVRMIISRSERLSHAIDLKVSRLERWSRSLQILGIVVILMKDLADDPRPRKTLAA